MNSHSRRAPCVQSERTLYHFNSAASCFPKIDSDFRADAVFRALPEALWGCLLWDDARAFKSDAIGGRKRKAEYLRYFLANRSTGAMVEAAQKFPVKADITPFGGAQMFRDDLVETRQMVKGNGGIGMVLGVVWHVPRDEAHEPGGEGGAGIFEHVGDMRAARMLGQEIAP